MGVLVTWIEFLLGIYTWMKKETYFLGKMKPTVESF